MACGVMYACKVGKIILAIVFHEMCHTCASNLAQTGVELIPASACEAAIPRYQCMPFGAGSRICIGMAFAMIAATALLTTLAQRLRVASVESRKPHAVACLTLALRGETPLRVTAR